MTVNVFLLVFFSGSFSLSDGVKWSEVALVCPSEGTGVTLPFREDVPLTGALAGVAEPSPKIFPRPILSTLNFPRL
jgi:hypothetical protein